MRRHVLAVFFFALFASVFSVPSSFAATFNAQQKLPANSLSQGLVGWWTFDGGDVTSSSAIDRSGKFNTSTLQNTFGVQPLVAGRVGRGLRTNPSYSDVRGSASIDDLTQKTATAWIRPSNIESTQIILMKGTGSFGGLGWRLHIISGGKLEYVEYRATTNGIWQSDSGVLSTSTWHYVTIAHDNTSMSNNPVFYVDGVSIPVNEISTPVGVVLNDNAGGTYRFSMGIETGTLLKKFNGIIDEVRYYNRILTPAEIKQLYGLGRVHISSDAGLGKPSTPKTLDSGGTVGDFTDIAQGSDGFPVMSYYDSSNTDLKFIKCNDAQCNSITTRTLDTLGGRYTSIAIGRDGFPVISYYASLSLKYAKCNDLSCSAPSIVTVDTGGVVGPHTSIAIDNEGKAVISYYDSSSADLKFVKCEDLTCSSKTIRTLDSTGSVGTYTTTVIGRDGFPAISYRGAGELKFIKCHDVSCSSITTRALDVSADVGAYASVTLGKDGLPIMSYTDSTNSDLKFVKCHDLTCSVVTTRTIESVGFTGFYTSLMLGRDGNPIISYYDSSNYALKVAKCSDISCSSISTVLLDDSISNLYNGTSIAMGKDGSPIISYYDFSNGDLKFIACGAYCGSGVTVGATQSSVIPSGLVGYWSFNGPDVDWRANKAKDRSGQGNDGDIINMSTSTAGKGGKVGQGFKFEMSKDQYIKVSPSASLNDIPQLSVSAWIKAKTPGDSDQGCIVGKGTNETSNAWFLGFYQGYPRQLKFSQAFTGSDGFWKTQEISLNEWHHVAVTYDRTSTANVPIFYIDSIATTTIVTSTPTGTAQSNQFYDLGVAARDIDDRHFDGLIDEVRVYNRILSASEIKSLYNAGK